MTWSRLSIGTSKPSSGSEDMVETGKVATPRNVALRDQPIGYFVHHQGRGHMTRCLAILRHLQGVPVHIFCADTTLFADCPDNVTVHRLPDFHGRAPRTRELLQSPNCESLDCSPIGVDAVRIGMGAIARWMADHNPALFVVDVSSEVALLARICSVPTVSIRMHGDRNDQAHRGAYSGASGILAPFDERLEQADWPDAFKRKTHYVGGLIARGTTHTREEARRKLGLNLQREIIVTLSGGGGAGANLGSLTIGARARPDALWLGVGEIQRHGHETDFGNLHCLGWVNNPLDYIAAADTVIAMPGDNVVHEVASVGRPLICIPEWCYYGEQARKAQALDEVGAAAAAMLWPSHFDGWRELLARASECDLDIQRSLTNPQAANEAADYLLALRERLWSEAQTVPTVPRATIAR